MGKLRAAAKGKSKAWAELHGVEVHFLSNKDAIVFTEVDLEARETIARDAATFSKVLRCFDLGYDDAEYMAVMPSFVGAAEFAEKYKAMGFKVCTMIAPQGSEREEMKRCRII